VTSPRKPSAISLRQSRSETAEVGNGDRQNPALEGLCITHNFYKVVGLLANR